MSSKTEPVNYVIVKPDPLAKQILMRQTTRLMLQIW